MIIYCYIMISQAAVFLAASIASACTAASEPAAVQAEADDAAKKVLCHIVSNSLSCGYLFTSQRPSDR